MISAFVEAFKKIISKPSLLFFVLISILFGKILGQLTVNAWIPISDIFTMWHSSESPFIALILSNPVEIIIILTATIISFTVSIIILEFLSRIVYGEKIVESINLSVLDWKKAFGVSFTMCTISLILWFLLIFFVQLGTINEFVSLSLVIILMVFTTILFVKLIFVFPAMIEEKNAKLALQKSWNFLNTPISFGKAILFFIILGIIILIFDLIILNILTILLQLGINNELLIDYTIPLIQDMFVTSFIGLAIAGYYYNK
jgi:hypothetical protein